MKFSIRNNIFRQLSFQVFQASPPAALLFNAERNTFPARFMLSLSAWVYILNEVTEKGHFEDQPDNHVEFFYRAVGKSLFLYVCCGLLFPDDSI